MPNSLFKKFFSSDKATDVSWEMLWDMANKDWLKHRGVSIFGEVVSSEILLFRTKMPRGTKFDLHQHSNAAERVTVTQGIIQINGKRQKAKGDTVKFSKGYAHEVEALQDADLNVLFYKRTT